MLKCWYRFDEPFDLTSTRTQAQEFATNDLVNASYTQKAHASTSAQENT